MIYTKQVILSGAIGALALLNSALAFGATTIYVTQAEGGLPSYTDEPVGPRSQVHMYIAPPPAPRAEPQRVIFDAESFSSAVPVDADIREVVRAAARRHSLPEALLLAVIHVESGFNPRARSPKGAIGLMQIMPPTGARYGVARDLHDPVKNIGVGANYLRDLLEMFRGNTSLALAAYNAGEGNVIRYGRTIPPFAETQAYVTKVLRQYALYTK
jgi:soluble lytic murein transglycosylase-like protein